MGVGDTKVCCQGVYKALGGCAPLASLARHEPIVRAPSTPLCTQVPWLLHLLSARELQASLETLPSPFPKQAAADMSLALACRQPPWPVK